jgi:uncharacterized protein YhjY with autotransporter beta-barrel domain
LRFQSVARRGLYLAATLFALLGLAPAALAQSITSSSVNPTTYTAQGQTLTFTFHFHSTTVLNSLTITANNSSGSTDAVNCPAATGFQPVDIDCTSIHTVTGSEAQPGAFSVDSPTYAAVTAGNQNDGGNGPQARANFVGAAAPTTTTVTSSPNPSNFGQTVTFTATVTGANPTGTVTFTANGATIATVALVGSSASFSTTTLPVGANQPITATYGGDSSNLTSTGSTAQTVSKASPTLSVSSSPNPSTIGQNVTFTATISGGSNPTGTVTFLDSGAPIGSGTLSGGVATFTINSLAPGSHTITASYPGDANNNSAAASAITQNVNRANTTLSVSSSLNPSTVGQSVTFTATVSGGSNPTGTVSFSDNGAPIGSGTVAAGVATFTTNSLPVGAGQTITASYTGDTNNSASSGATPQTVNKAAATVTVTSSLNPSTIGQSVTFTATVAGSNPTGTVTFSDNGAPIGSGAISGGQATFTTNALPAGAGQTITAAYPGDANNNPGTGTVLQNVNKATNVVAVTSSVNPSMFGQSVTFTATVTGSSPTGTVTFSDNGAPIGSGTISGGTATFTTSALPVGASQTIAAAYPGDAGNQGGTGTMSQTVLKASTSVSLIASSTAVQFNQPVTLTASVVGKSPTGTVTFKDGGTVLGTVALNGAGQALLTLSALAVGSHSIIASYGGDANNAASASSALALSVNRPNPADDPDVRGLVTAQITSETRFAQTQVDNVVQRLEALHDDTPFFSNNLGFGALPPQPPQGYSQLVDPTDPLKREPAFVAIDKASRNGAGAPKMETPPFAIWTAGTVDFGSTSVTGTTQSPDNHYTTAGITAGLDYRFTPDIKAGFAFGFGDDHTDIGSNGTTSKATNISGTAYASYHALGSIFLDGLVGYGSASFHSNRAVSETGGFETGQRPGSEIYGALVLTSEQKWDAFRFAPYTRLQFIDATLDAFTEQGDPVWALSYASANMHEISGVVGMRVSYDFDMGWGLLSPTLRAEYSRAFDTNLTQSLAYANTPNVDYAFGLAGLGQNTVSGNVGLQARYANGVTAALEYEFSSSGSFEQSQGLRGSLKVPF